MAAPAEPPSVAAALAQARARGVAQLDAQLLLAHVLQRPRAWLLAHDEQVLDGPAATAWAGLLARRAAGEPLAYLLGEREFHGLSLHVDPAVLIPRPDTETLVDWALALLDGPLAGLVRPRVVDLGTGSGAIALALKRACPAAEVQAVELSAPALAVARANAERLGLEVGFHLGHWWTPLAGQRFHLALSNPPYIEAGDPHLAALGHEPGLALSPGADGLAALREIVEHSPAHLEPGGWLLLEHGHDQAEATRALLSRRGYTEVGTRHDLAGLPRCSGGRLADPRVTPGIR